MQPNLPHCLACLCLAVAVLVSALSLHKATIRRSPASRSLLTPVGPGTLVAIPDLHGDYHKAIATLRMLGVINEHGAWVGKDITLVQLGDLLDRGPHSLQLVSLFRRLQVEAALAGSKVILLLGNHELMNLQQDLRYVNPHEFAQLGRWDGWLEGPNNSSTSSTPSSGARLPSSIMDGEPSVAATAAGPQLQDREAHALGVQRWRALLHTQGALRQELQRRQWVAVAGSGVCRSVFVHAGLTAPVLHELLTALHELQMPSAAEAGVKGFDVAGAWGDDQHKEEQRVMQDLSVMALERCTPNGCSQPEANPTAAASDSNGDVGGIPGHLLLAQRLYSVLSSSRGPVWVRQLAQGREAVVCEEVKQVLNVLGVARMVVGHTVQEGGKATTRCGGRLLLLDTGMSAHILGSPPTAFVCTTGSAGPAQGGHPGFSSHSRGHQQQAGVAVNSAALVGVNQKHPSHEEGSCYSAVRYGYGERLELPCLLKDAER